MDYSLLAGACLMVAPFIRIAKFLECALYESSVRRATGFGVSRFYLEFLGVVLVDIRVNIERLELPALLLSVLVAYIEELLDFESVLFVLLLLL